ncbi:MAG: O-antigen ligase family protein [Candidatus Roizmanbacteria bacterium]|nr:O-antigen ligase family protein [Candidatus Roizmanbacteria bacterium]
MLNALTLLFPLGEILYVHITPSIRIRLLDILVLLFCIEMVIKNKRAIIHGFKDSGLTFLTLAITLSTFINVHTATFSSIAYVLRILLYFFFFFCIVSIKRKPKKITLYFIISFSVILLTSLFQYLLYPSLRNLMYAGYDPHEYRLFGLFLDPNLIGLFFVWSFLYLAQKKQVILSLLVGCVLLLTYSRISYIAAVISGIYLLFSHIKTRRTIVFAMLAILSLVTILVFLPKRQGEGTNLMRTNSIVSKMQAFTITQKALQINPLFGVGFNYFPSASTKDSFVNNSKYGLDNSLLTILTTSGIIGLFGYVWFFLTVIKGKTAVFKAMSLAYGIHALSTNSFFTPTLFVVFGIFYILTLSDT